MSPTKPSSFRSHYQALVTSGELEADTAQAAAVVALGELEARLAQGAGE